MVGIDKEKFPDIGKVEMEEEIMKKRADEQITEGTSRETDKKERRKQTSKIRKRRRLRRERAYKTKK